MRRFILLLFLLYSIASFSQRIYTKAELLRLQDLGRLWGMVNYFHPAMGTGKIVTDSLIIGNAASLAADPSAKNFTAVVANMLGQLNDPSTAIKTEIKKEDAVLFSPKKDEALVKKFSNGYWYIALPTAALENQATAKLPSLFPDAWDSAKGIITDLRNKDVNASHGFDYNFLNEVYDLVRNKLAGSLTLPTVYERSIYHGGMVNQTDGTNNVYGSGWGTMTKGIAAVTRSTVQQKIFDKPFAFVINAATSSDIVGNLLSLRAAKKCLIFYEGDPKTIAAGSTIDVAVADGQTVSLRVSDRLIGDGGIPQPDIVVDKIKDGSWQSDFISQCFAALDNWNKTMNSAPVSSSKISLNFIIPKPAAYADNMAPSVGYRLFALYNYWNAIQYFFGYKNLLPDPWDDKLIKHLPSFIGANDGVKYSLAIRHLASEIHDSHGYIGNFNGVTPMREVYGYWPPVTVEYIGDKLYIIDIGKDSLQDITGIALWDEIETINGEPVAKAAEKWRTYFATSNESTFKRDVVYSIINGAKGTKVTLGINRGGAHKTIELVCTGRNQTIGRRAVDFNDDYPVLKKLDRNIGYVNMGALKKGQVDSMFIELMNTKAIIFDIRNYPKGTAWSIAPRLAAKEAKAVRFETPRVTWAWINGGEDAEQALSYFIVRPDTTKPRYKGKVIMLCNQQTQSQAEYTIMMFQGATAVTVIGSQTAGADGNVTDVVMPGGYTAFFSGSAAIYPDGTGTQRSGIKIDIQAKPTLAGLKAGKDEVMERALQFIKTGK